MIYSNEPLSRAGARFNAGRTFDVEDDVEFCPALSEEEINLYRYGVLSDGSPNSANNFNSLSSAAQTTPPHNTTIPDYYFNSGSSSGSPVSRAQGLANGSTYFYTTGNGQTAMVATGNGAGGSATTTTTLIGNTSTPVRSNISSPGSSSYYATPSHGTVYYTANNSYNSGSPMRGYNQQYPVSAGGDSYGTPIRGRAW